MFLAIASFQKTVLMVEKYKNKTKERNGGGIISCHLNSSTKHKREEDIFMSVSVSVRVSRTDLIIVRKEIEFNEE